MSYYPNTSRHRTSLPSINTTGNDRNNTQNAVKYRSVMEMVTREKKKEICEIDYMVDAPKHYTYVPFGIPKLTDKCKELSRLEGVLFYIVSGAERPRNRRHHDDPLTDRMGHHFTTDIVVRATGFLGLGGIHDQVSRGRELIDGNYDLNKQNDYYWKSRGWVEDKATDEQRATVFRDAMKELFPQMPDEDVVMVLTRAILKFGRDIVLNNRELVLGQRIQRTVLAHIRHTYTGYDRLLDEGLLLRHDARTLIWPTIQDVLRLWRAEVQEPEVEEAFREVIVIEDDDDLPAQARIPRQRKQVAIPEYWISSDES